MATLEQRVIELERRCRRLQLAAIGAGALLFAACLSGAFAAPSRVLRAERFDLVNANGELRGALELDGTTPRLVLASPENESFVALCAGPNVTEERAGTAWFRFPEGTSGFDVEERAAPIRHGLAVLTLGAPSCTTELVADKLDSYLTMLTDGPSAVLLVGEHEGDRTRPCSWSRRPRTRREATGTRRS